MNGCTMIFVQRQDEGKDADGKGAAGTNVRSRDSGNWILFLVMGVDDRPGGLSGTPALLSEINRSSRRIRLMRSSSFIC